MSLNSQIARKVFNVMKIPCANYNVACEKGRWKDRTAVVTGAGSGIGKAIAKEMVKSKIMVAGMDKRKDRLDELRAQLPKKSQEYFHAIACDVSQQDTVNKAFDTVCEKFGGVDILVNNAGILIPGQIVKLDMKKLQSLVDTNVMSVLYCTQRALKSMNARKIDGHVINICGVLGHQTSLAGGVQSLNVYPGTKFALKAVSETLRQELRGLKQKIKVTNVSPGSVDSEFIDAKNKPKELLKTADVAACVMFALFTPPNVNVFQVTVKPVGEQF